MSGPNKRSYKNDESDDTQFASLTESEKMDVNELLNYFEVHPKRKSDIVRVYSSRFGQSIVGIQTPRESISNDTNLRQSDTGNEIHIYGQKMWLNYLNAFGSVITRLKIYYSELTEIQCRQLHKHIVQTCAINLIEIKFIGIKPEHPIDDLANYQFPNVKRIEIMDSVLYARLPLFSRPFPNVRVLKVINVNMDEFDAYFKHLERFVIVKDDNGVKNVINMICKD